MSDDEKLEMVETIVRKYLAKVRAEREARLAGEVVAADFYLRQITCLEVGLDLLATENGMTGWQALTAARRDGHGILAIAETPFSRALDEQRRRMWSEAGEPERPEHPPQRYLEDHGSYALEPTEAWGAAGDPPPDVDPDTWADMTAEEQRRAFAQLHQQEAAAQLEWEREAQAEWAERNGLPAPLPHEGEGDSRVARAGRGGALQEVAISPKPPPLTGPRIRRLD